MDFRKIYFFRLIIFVASVLWIMGLISPCLHDHVSLTLFPYLKLFYSTVCHQESHKSFVCGAGVILVCARCTGIYTAVLFTSFIILIMNIRLKFRTSFFLFLSMPMLLDVILHSTGIYEYSKIVAAITGMLFGSAVFLYILNGVENSLYKRS